MNKPIRSNNPGLRFLLQYWQKYCRLDPWHVQWAKQHIVVQNKLPKGTILYNEGEKQKVVYLVVRGLLARVSYHGDGYKRQILSLALPGMALMTTSHLYSPSPSIGNIIVLQAQTTLVEIPYKAILHFKEQEPQLNTLLGVLTNKKKKQLSFLRIMTSIPRQDKRYDWFAHNMGEFATQLTLQEMADLLGTSLSTIKRLRNK